MTRATVVRVLLSIVVLATSGWLVATREPRLGLDLRGGTQIVLETKDGTSAKANARTTDQALEVLRRRIDSLGVSEPTIARSGERRIIIELPGVTDPREAVEVIGRTAELTFRPVKGAVAPQDKEHKDKEGEVTLNDEQGGKVTLGPPALTGQQVSDAQARLSDMGQWQVDIDFRGSGQRAWEKLTGGAACQPPGDPRRRVAIVLDREVISSPQVNEDIACNVGILGGSTTITGSFAEQEAKDLALLVRGGSLPVPVEIIQQGTVGPTLGAAAIEASAEAAVIGLIATILFIIAVYRLAGGLAAISLMAYGLISYSALLAFGATLTLPGLAGFVLAIGMAVDANVLVFERSREEYGRAGIRVALRKGFDNAFSAIADSNVTTLLAAGLLFFLASGPVRGFGVTLSIGVIASMFTALVLTRALTESVLTVNWLRRRPNMSGLAKQGRVRTFLEARNPDLMGRRRRWLAVSAVAVVLALSGVFVRGLDLGVEFTGGRIAEFTTGRPVPIDQAREAVADAGLPRAVVQEADKGAISVRAAGMDQAQQDRIRAELAERAGSAERIREDFVGPSLGEELRNKALIALLIALAAQLAYLAFRFQWRWGAATVVALAHDVAILVGAFAWLGRPIDGVFLASLLTVIGYSVNDKVVVFDRVRELVTSAAAKIPFAGLVNRAVLQTLPRTVNTGLGAIFVLAALAVLGGDSLVDFAVALLIGIGVGTYSSIFVASPVAIELAGTGPPKAQAKGGRATSAARR
ncbi:MAG: protein translocase subunit SecD [Streptosporangiales bacterium]|nr:protein translocase subunit SecD [Streptosporangiales bacterium]